MIVDTRGGGTSNIGYLYEDTEVCIDSTICTPTYNEKLYAWGSFHMGLDSMYIHTAQSPQGNFSLPPNCRRLKNIGERQRDRKYPESAFPVP